MYMMFIYIQVYSLYWSIREKKTNNRRSMICISKAYAFNLTDYIPVGECLYKRVLFFEKVLLFNWDRCRSRIPLLFC